MLKDKILKMMYYRIDEVIDYRINIILAETKDEEISIEDINKRNKLFSNINTKS